MGYFASRFLGKEIDYWKHRARRNFFNKKVLELKKIAQEIIAKDNDPDCTVHLVDGYRQKIEEISQWM